MAELSGPTFDTLTEADKAFVKHEERVLRELITNLIGVAEVRATEKVEKMVWSDRMRLICCFEDDDIVEAYRLTQLSMTRTELDARNSEARGPDFYDLVMAKFNDSAWVATSQAMPSLHRHFKEEEHYLKRGDYTLDASKAKNIISWEKNKIMSVLRKYDKSGNGATNAAELYQLGEGEGAWTDEEIHAKWGHFDADLAESNGGDDREDYLNGQPTDILYWWAVLDKLDLLQATCVVFKRELAAGTIEQPTSVAELTRKKKAARHAKANAGAEAVSEQLSAIGSSLSSMSRSRIEEGVQRSIDSIEDLRSKRKAEQKELYTDARDAPDEYKAIICQRIEDLDESIQRQEEYIEQANKRLKTTH